MNVPYRDYIDREYVGQREKEYERELAHRSVVAIWGKPGIGKTWVGAKLAIQWETRGFAFAPYSGPSRRACWIACKKNAGFYELVMEIAEWLKQRGQEDASRTGGHLEQDGHPQIDLPTLRQLITNHFDDGELRNLCFDLRVDYDDLGGRGKKDKGRELVLHFKRRDRLYDLVLACHQRRPNAPWRDIVLGPLSGQSQMSLWHWLQSRPTRIPAAAEVIERLTELLNQEQYLLCFDDLDYVVGDQNVRLLFEMLEKGLDKAATKVILVGQRAPKIPGIGSRKLRPLDRTDIQKLVLALNVYDKPWLTEAIAARFAERLLDLVDTNLKLMNIVAINWLRSHTTQVKAEAYLEALNKAQITELILQQGEDIQRTLLLILSTLEGWNDPPELFDIATCYVDGIEKEALAQAMETLFDARLVQQNENQVHLHPVVRQWCRQRLVGRHQDLSDLYRCVADAHVRQADWLPAIERYMDAHAFSMALQLLVEHTVEITRAGGGARASKQLVRLRRIAGTTDQLDIRDVLWEQILTGDLKAWLGELDAAQAAVKMGFQILDQIPSKERPTYQYEEGRLKARLGTILPEQGKLKEGIQLLEESKQLMQAGIWERDITYQVSKVQPLMTVLNNLGLAHRLLAHRQRGTERAVSFDKAIRFYTDCANMGRAFEGMSQIDYTVAWGLLGLAQVYDDRNENSDRVLALKKAQDGLEKFQEIDHKWGIGFANRTLGTIYFRLGDYTKAAEFRRQGLKAAYQCDDRQAIILTNVGLAEIYIWQDDLEAAQEYLQVAQKVLPQVQMPWLAERVSRFQRWLQGVSLCHKGELTAGERVLHGVLKDFREGGPDYAAEASLVEQQLRDFGCSVPEPKAESPTLPPPPPEPQDRIGRYQLRGELGSGALGTVYQAYDPHTDRTVALKVMKPLSGPRAQERQERFRREARAAGKLKHPNIVLVYDADVADGQWYIVMEYLEGRTLEEIIVEDGPQPLEWVKEVVAQVCDALCYAHERGVIHRDVKPSNIMILDNGQVKVTDFGLASVAADASLTQADDFVGTPRYASPEQIQDSGRVDRRSDIFALGAVSYELLTGEPAFPGERHTPIYHITSPEPVDLGAGREHMPDAVRRVLEKALAKDPDERFSTCSQFSEAMMRAAQGATYNTAAIRELLSKAFSPRELETFCFDHFPDVQENFSPGMPKDAKIQLLMDFCQRHLLFKELLDAIRQVNPNQYARFESQLK